ncbi:4-hydroxy-tetrahydrodipicolinate synthase [Streptosporangium lutulentum]|uniref:4-hydroxy-tetrahydrodipicolinate synthase n=1 Tax=Streptosporangium lutulentum TaxID=1461250 RepID=A0ABT9QIB1_9ACTN|nr:4-hydroxy-tetrahydrodipicolinate synthase [Streptosporangium lutulentum]MDP9845809.1 4-hydroxy-tetrahydrodipicolinate synthase [Streptosporangium lutulentum]
MAAPIRTSDAPFGHMLTAMVTPFTGDGAVDYEGVQRLATYLVDEQRNDGLIVSGTTGESPTTSDDEKERILRAVVEAVGDRAAVVAGAGSNDTHHSVELARAAERAGAHGLLLVTPYYSKPPQEGLYRHFTAVADATGLPVMLYDIPGRSGVPILTETLIRLARHERIIAVKDAKADLFAGSQVMAATGLVFYSGDDTLNLPWLSVGAAGCVSVVGHVVGAEIAAMMELYRSGDVSGALGIHRRLLPVISGIMTQAGGAIMAKAALSLVGQPVGPSRLPLVEATEEQVARLREDLIAGGVKLSDEFGA